MAKEDVGVCTLITGRSVAIALTENVGEVDGYGLRVVWLSNFELWAYNACGMCTVDGRGRNSDRAWWTEMTVAQSCTGERPYMATVLEPRVTS